MTAQPATAPLPDHRDRPVLIFGAPRSGTSLLSRVRDAHSAICIPCESHLFNQWHGRRGADGELSDPARQRRLVQDIVELGVVQDWSPLPDVDAVMEQVKGAGFPAVSRAILAWAAHTAGKRRWGEKTPHHTLLHRDVLAAWPDAAVVMIERDPRDVALSWKKARFGGDHVLPFAKAWVAYAKACADVRETLPEDRWTLVRYEDLVRDPQAHLDRFMAFLGERFEEGQLGFHTSGAEFKTDARNLAQLQKPISEKSIGSWRKGLSPAELRLIETVAGPVMVERGYPLEADRPSTPLEMSPARFIGYPIQRARGLLKNGQGLTYAARDFTWQVRRLTGRTKG